MKFYIFAPFYKMSFNKILCLGYGYIKKYIDAGSA